MAMPSKTCSRVPERIGIRSSGRIEMDWNHRFSIYGNCLKNKISESSLALICITVHKRVLGEVEP